MFNLSQISFIAFCIEKYSEYKNLKSNEVYKLLYEHGIIDILIEDYEDLHGQGFEYMMPYIDKLLQGVKL